MGPFNPNSPLRVPFRRGLAGLLIGVGAPLGWLVLRLSGGATLRQELRQSRDLYLYLTVTTTLTFATFGFALGRLEERLAMSNEELTRLSRTDPLTGLENARVFAEALPRLIAESRRIGFPLSLLMVDVDVLKRINDRWGHVTGNRVLRHVAQLLSRDRRREDVVVRIGGDEFAVLLPGTDHEQALAVARRLLDAIAATPVRCENRWIRVTLSVGVAQLAPSDDEPGFLHRADQALYVSKRSGRNRVSIAPARLSDSPGSSSPSRA